MSLGIIENLISRIDELEEELKKLTEEKKAKCSFCGKLEEDAYKLIAAADGVFICDECIELCSEIIKEQREKEGL